MFLFLDHNFIDKEKKLCEVHGGSDCSEHSINVQPLQHGRLLKHTLVDVSEPLGSLHREKDRLRVQPEKNHYNSTSHSQYRKQSFTLSIRYMDQATWGARRVRSLQCWAAQLDRIMRVVEPSMNNTYLGAPVRKPVDGILKFSDVFDIDWWNQFGEEQAGFLPLVSWEEFFLHAPRKTILVQIVYQQDTQCFEDSLLKLTCTLNEVKNFWLKTLRGFSFKVIRRVCIDFRDLEDVITKKELNGYIFGKIPVDMPVTVVFNDWRGPLREAKTKKSDNNCLLRFRDPTCSPSGPHGLIHDITLNALRPTPEVFHSAELYAAKYLTGNSKYIAIMVRWELLFLEHIYHDFKGPSPSGKTCTEMIVKYVLAFQLTRGLNTIFVATDVGRYGSEIMHPKTTLYGESHYESGKNLTEELLETLYGRPITLEQYDRQFDEFNGTTVHPTYYVP